MKQIYIVLIQAHTGLGSVARRLTKFGYTHIAVSLDASLTDFVSYSRRRHYLPFDAGFTHEKRDFYAFGKHQSVKVKVFRIPVDDAHAHKIMDFIHHCENDSAQMFNLFAMLAMPVLHGLPIAKAHTCMSFTANVIRLSGAVRMKKSIHRYHIEELDALLQDFFWKEGFLKRIPSAEYEAYMKKPSAVEYLRCGASMIVQLTKRLIFS